MFTGGRQDIYQTASQCFHAVSKGEEEVAVARDPAEREQGGERTPGKVGKRFPAFHPPILQNESSHFSALER